MSFKRYKLIENQEGAVALLMITLFLLSLTFSLIALDYHNLNSLKKKIEDIAEQSVLAGGIICRKEQITLGDTSSLDPGVKQNAEQKTNETFTNGIQAIQSHLDSENLSTLSTKVEYIPAQTGTTPSPSRCRITLTYSGLVKNFISSILSVPINEVPISSSAEATFGTIGDSKLEIDFLIDTSGSMSTVANPEDRNWVMLLTRSEDVAEAHQSNGCTFMCHSRRALLPEDASKRIDAIMDGSMGTHIVAYHTDGMPLPGSYLGGFTYLNKADFDKRKPASLKKYTYTGENSKCNPERKPYEICTSKNASLYMLDDVLKGFNIKLKSDVIYENTLNLISHLKNRAPNRINIAMHAFHGSIPLGSEPNYLSIVKTFIPYTRALNSEQTIALKDLNLNDIKSEYFDYAVPDPGNTYIDTAYRFPSNRNTCGFITSPFCADFPSFAPLSGNTSIPLRAAGNDLRYKTTEAIPVTYARKAIDAVRFTVRWRRYAGPVPKDRKRILVILTDGIEDENRTGGVFGSNGISGTGHGSVVTGGTGQAPGNNSLAYCTDWKLLDGGIVMVLHSYYRFQPGSVASDELRQKLGGKERLHLSNIDRVEKELNEGPIRDGLIGCASPNPNKKPGQDDFYYFPANNVQELESAFDHLLGAILEAGSESPVRIVE
jgi:hypothetical protein